MDIFDRIVDHYEESLNYFPNNNIIGIFLQGSQNYHLETSRSDVDTKLLVAPSFNEIALAKQPVSHTHVRSNNEHIDFKDIRLMIQTFRKQNINFIECLFTSYKMVTDKYASLWAELCNRKEDIAHYDPAYAVKSMMGQIRQKRKYLQNDSEGRHANIEKYGYDPKELHHIIRFEEFMRRYIAGESFEDCLIPKDRDYLIHVKEGWYDENEAVIKADLYVSLAEETADTFINTYKGAPNQEVSKFLDDMQIKFMKEALKEEFKQ